LLPTRPRRSFGMASWPYLYQRLQVLPICIIMLVLIELGYVKWNHSAEHILALMKEYCRYFKTVSILGYLR
jgi:hypothetical protein